MVPCIHRRSDASGYPLGISIAWQAKARVTITIGGELARRPRNAKRQAIAAKGTDPVSGAATTVFNASLVNMAESNVGRAGKFVAVLLCGDNIRFFPGRSHRGHSDLSRHDLGARRGRTPAPGQTRGLDVPGGADRLRRRRQADLPALWDYAAGFQNRGRRDPAAHRAGYVARTPFAN